jgi:hypothetical protein
MKYSNTQLTVVLRLLLWDTKKHQFFVSSSFRSSVLFCSANKTLMRLLEEIQLTHFSIFIALFHISCTIISSLSFYFCSLLISFRFILSFFLPFFVFVSPSVFKLLYHSYYFSVFSYFLFLSLFFNFFLHLFIITLSIFFFFPSLLFSFYIIFHFLSLFILFGFSLTFCGFWSSFFLSLKLVTVHTFFWHSSIMFTVPKKYVDNYL